jgi:hypothetical protein
MFFITVWTWDGHPCTVDQTRERWRSMNDVSQSTYMSVATWWLWLLLTMPWVTRQYMSYSHVCTYMTSIHEMYVTHVQPSEAWFRHMMYVKHTCCVHMCCSTHTHVKYGVACIWIYVCPCDVCNDTLYSNTGRWVYAPPHPQNTVRCWTLHY